MFGDSPAVPNTPPVLNKTCGLSRSISPARVSMAPARAFHNDAVVVAVFRNSTASSARRFQALLCPGGQSVSTFAFFVPTDEDRFLCLVVDVVFSPVPLVAPAGARLSHQRTSPNVAARARSDPVAAAERSVSISAVRRTVCSPGVRNGPPDGEELLDDEPPAPPAGPLLGVTRNVPSQ